MNKLIIVVIVAVLAALGVAFVWFCRLCVKHFKWQEAREPLRDQFEANRAKLNEIIEKGTIPGYCDAEAVDERIAALNKEAERIDAIKPCSIPLDEYTAELESLIKDSELTLESMGEIIIPSDHVKLSQDIGNIFKESTI